MTLPSLAARIRRLADDVSARAGEERDARTAEQVARQRFLMFVAAELHRLARVFEGWIERGGA